MKTGNKWRLSYASDLAACYCAVNRVATVMVTSSTARNHDDKFSDIDLVAFWDEQPPAPVRESIVERTGGDLVGLYGYDTEWKKWFDMYTIGRDKSNQEHGGVCIDVMHYLTDQAVIMMDAVLYEFATDEPSHNLLALLQNGIPLHGRIQLRRWQKSICYPMNMFGGCVKSSGLSEFSGSMLQNGNLSSERSKYECWTLSWYDRSVIGAPFGWSLSGS